MNHKRITMTSIVLTTLLLVSLFAVVSSETSVSGTVMGGTGPAVYMVSSSTGQVDIFAVDSTGGLQYTPYGDSSSWNSLGGVSTSSPAAVSWSTNPLRLDVFVRGTDGALWHKYYQNGWSNKWESLGGQLAAGTGPAVSSWSAGRLDLFVQGTDGALWHKAWTGAKWSGWQSLGGKLTSSPAATSGALSSPGKGTIEVFVRGSDGAVWQKNWNGVAWSSWASIGGQVAPNTGPAVSQDLWVIVQGTDHQLWQKNVEGVGGTWAAPGSPPEALATASPGATLNVMDHTMVAVTTTSGNVWLSAHDVAGNLGGWSSAGSP